MNSKLIWLLDLNNTKWKFTVKKGKGLLLWKFNSVGSETILCHSSFCSIHLSISNYITEGELLLIGSWYHSDGSRYQRYHTLMNDIRRTLPRWQPDAATPTSMFMTFTASSTVVVYTYNWSLTWVELSISRVLVDLNYQPLIVKPFLVWLSQLHQVHDINYVIADLHYKSHW